MAMGSTSSTRAHRHKPHVILDDLIDFREIRDVPVRDDSTVFMPVFIRRHGFFAQAADGQHAAPAA